MNVMYTDKQFLSVFYVPDMPLVQRLILSNLKRQNPYDLTEELGIDKRTLSRHQNIRPEEYGELKSSAWSFYLPTPECPLNYRQLSFWFVLVSVIMAKQKKQRHMNPYSFEAFSGLEQLIGVGQREASELAEQVEECGHNLITVKRSGGCPLFIMRPYDDKAHWFKSIQDTSEIPQDVLDMVRQDNEAQAKRQAEAQARMPQKIILPEQTYSSVCQELNAFKSIPEWERRLNNGEMSSEEMKVYLDDNINKVVKNSKPFDGLQKYQQDNITRFGQMPKYTDEHKQMIDRQIAIEQEKGRIAEVNKTHKQPILETITNEARPHIEEPHTDTEEDFLARLKAM